MRFLIQFALFCSHEQKFLIVPRRFYCLSEHEKKSYFYQPSLSSRDCPPLHGGEALSKHSNHLKTSHSSLSAPHSKHHLSKRVSLHESTPQLNRYKLLRHHFQYAKLAKVFPNTLTVKGSSPPSFLTNCQNAPYPLILVSN